MVSQPVRRRGGDGYPSLSKHQGARRAQVPPGLDFYGLLLKRFLILPLNLKGGRVGDIKEDSRMAGLPLG